MRVPTYGDLRVSTRPIHQQGIQVRAVEGAFGGGQGLGALAQGMAHLGRSLAEARELEDMTRAKEAENEFALYMQGAMYGDNGYMLSQGRVAFEGRDGFMREAEKKRKEIAGRLKGGAQKAFNQASTMRMLNVNGQVLQHAGAQQKSWVRETSAARTELFAQDAWNAIGNEAEMNKNIAAGILEIRKQGELEGLSREALALKERAFVSGAQSGVVAKLAMADPIAAADYLAKVGGQIDPTTRADLERKLKAPLVQAKAEREVAMAQMKQVGDFKFSQQVNDAIIKAAAKYGVSNQALAVIAMIESKGHAGARNPHSTAGGLFQQINSNAKQYGVKNRFDPYQSADGAAAFMRDNQVYLRRQLGREPTIGELYLAHQQGPSGAAKLLTNPSGLAVDAVGRQAVRLNFPKRAGESMQEFNARIGAMSAREFAQVWIDKAERVAGGGIEIEDHIAKINDPDVRALAQDLFGKQVAAQKAQTKQARDETIDWLDGQLIGYPQMDLKSLPLDMQAMLGASGMQKLRNYQKSMLEAGDVKTDDAVYVELVRLSRDDPDGFAQINPLDYRDQLSNSDWKQVTGWWRAARDKSGGGGDKVGFTMAKGIAREQLDALGINAKNKKERQEAQFYRALIRELGEFTKKNKRAANEVEASEIVNRLLLPVVITEPGSSWRINPFSSDDRDGYAFEASERAIEDQVKQRKASAYDQIPTEEAQEVHDDLFEELGRKPSKQEVTERWFGLKMGVEEPAAASPPPAAVEEEPAHVPWFGSNPFPRG